MPSCLTLGEQTASRGDNDSGPLLTHIHTEEWAQTQKILFWGQITRLSSKNWQTVLGIKSAGIQFFLLRLILLGNLVFLVSAAQSSHWQRSSLTLYRRVVSTLTPGRTTPPTHHHIVPGAEADCTFLYLSLATAQSTATVRPVRQESNIRKAFPFLTFLPLQMTSHSSETVRNKSRQ